jgi:uncharacterized membrane protein YjjP (DUF1212 family)
MEIFLHSFTWVLLLLSQLGAMALTRRLLKQRIWRLFFLRALLSLLLCSSMILFISHGFPTKSEAMWIGGALILVNSLIVIVSWLNASKRRMRKD